MCGARRARAGAALPAPPRLCVSEGARGSSRSPPPHPPLRKLGAAAQARRRPRGEPAGLRAALRAGAAAAQNPGRPPLPATAGGARARRPCGRAAAGRGGGGPGAAAGPAWRAGAAERGLRRGSQFKKLWALRHGGVRAARAPVTLSAVNSLFLGGGAEGFLSGRRPARARVGTAQPLSGWNPAAFVTSNSQLLNL